MFDDLSFIDDNDCMGDCEKCPYCIWHTPYIDDPYPCGCKIGENRE